MLRIITLVVGILTCIFFAKWLCAPSNYTDHVKAEVVDKEQYKGPRGRDVFEIYYKLDNGKVYSERYTPYVYKQKNIGDVVYLNNVHRSYTDPTYRETWWGVGTIIGLFFTFVLVTWVIEDKLYERY